MKSGEPALPHGWKRRPTDGAAVCGDCWRRRYILRAVTFSVAGPVGRTWAELRPVLKTCFTASTTVANAVVLELAKTDCARTAGMAKLPAHPRPYLYPLVRQVAPEMDSTTASALLRAVERKYMAIRHQVVWLRKAALPLYRYPTPYPVHNRTWRAEVGAGGEALVSLRLGGERWTLRLSGGPAFRHHRRAHQKLVDGVAVAGELALYEVPSGGGDHRPQGTATTRLMCKMVLWLPRDVVPRERSGTMHVRARPDLFLTVETAGSGYLWTINGDWMRQAIVGHSHALQKLREDVKAEKRLTRSRGEALRVRLQRISHRQGSRVTAFCHETTASIAARAARSNVATVTLHKSEGTFMPSFPWYCWTEMLRTKLDERGILLIDTDASGECVEENGEALANG